MFPAHAYVYALRRVSDHERERTTCWFTYRDLCANGYRSLAVAYANVPAKDVYGATDETKLVLAGFLTFSDPPLATAKSTLRALQRDGIQVRF